jgi:hypothetical protein
MACLLLKVPFNNKCCRSKYLHAVIILFTGKNNKSPCAEVEYQVVGDRMHPELALGQAMRLSLPPHK